MANWKMNPKGFKEARDIFETIKKTVKKSVEVSVVICPPFLWLRELKQGGGLCLGAQNCHWESSGAYTGEISALMLADAGAKFALVGHSERRHFMGESDEIINLKMKAILRAGLSPILCVGEKNGEEMGLVVEEQLTACLAGLNVNQVKKIIIAYEPVWAIGTGHNCSADGALSAAVFIKKVLTKLYSRFLADKTPVIYGGSVQAENGQSYLKQAGMDGVLVGRVGLDAEEFVALINGLNQ